MAEFRRDITTGEWVILATERTYRPEDFVREDHELDESSSVCPFCPGQESSTPDEVFAVRTQGEANTPGWQVRVIPNKFAAVSPDLLGERHGSEDLFPRMNGFGFHEVIVETPDHEADLASLDVATIQLVLDAYLARYRALQQHPQVRFILLFRNHGIRAGTSLKHPHSQLLALPLVPTTIRDRLEFAARYFDATGRCVYCTLVQAEQQAQERLIAETAHFVVFAPFASRVPFETWIAPKRHTASFGDIARDELVDFAAVLGQTLRRLAKSLGNPDYNYAIYSAAKGAAQQEDYLWHLQLTPRLTTPAGFELGSGMAINIVAPEEAARCLREAGE